MFLRFSTKNIIPARLRNPLNFCYGDYPDKIEICWTELGTNDKQLLNFFYGQAYKI